MKLSAPIYRLKHRARQMAREKKIALHVALDQVAQAEGYNRWSLLAAQLPADAPAKSVLTRLADGDLFLLGARPGHGKTELGLQLLLERSRKGCRAVFFTLELTEAETTAHLRRLDGAAGHPPPELEVVSSDEICADFIMRHLAGSPPGTMAIVDYLQVLDQQRTRPPLGEQMRLLKSFARETGVVLGFIAQIHRSFDPASKTMPDMQDLRLPNPVDPALFSKACFLHEGEIRMHGVA